MTLFAFQLAPIAHVAILFGDRQQLEQDSLGLKRASKYPWRQVFGGRFSAQHARRGRLVALDHVGQKALEQLPARSAVRQWLSGSGSSSRFAGDGPHWLDLRLGSVARHCTGT